MGDRLIRYDELNERSIRFKNITRIVMSGLTERKNDISDWTYIRKFSQINIISSIFLAIGIVLSHSSFAQAFPVKSQWQGIAKGQVFNQTFQLPIVIEFNPAKPGENNPFNLAIGIGTPQQIGNSNLYSALTYSNGATLQYLSIQASPSQLEAQLDNHHTAEAAAANQFYASNVSAQYAPPVMQSIYGSLGTAELFVFNEGSSIVMGFDENDRLVGRIEGTGSSVAGIFPVPPIGYQALFVLERVK